MGWLKEKWQECWTPNKNLTEKLIKLWNSNREKGVDIYQHWVTMGKSLARCNLDQLDGKKVQDELQVAIYLDRVQDTELTKQRCASCARKRIVVRTWRNLSKRRWKQTGSMKNFGKGGRPPKK